MKRWVINMINVITTLCEEQQLEARNNLYNLNNIAVCSKCGALIQFDERDINREKQLPHIGCPCGNSVQLHQKYYFPNKIQLFKKRLKDLYDLSCELLDYDEDEISDYDIIDEIANLKNQYKNEFIYNL